MFAQTSDVTAVASPAARELRWVGGERSRPGAGGPAGRGRSARRSRHSPWAGLGLHAIGVRGRPPPRGSPPARGERSRRAHRLWPLRAFRAGSGGPAGRGAGRLLPGRAAGRLAVAPARHRRGADARADDVGLRARARGVVLHQRAQRGFSGAPRQARLRGGHPELLLSEGVLRGRRGVLGGALCDAGSPAVERPDSATRMRGQ